MATFRLAHRNPISRGLTIAPFLIALGAVTPAVASAGPRPTYDDVTYGEIPPATFGAAVATAPETDAIADGHDDVSYGAAARTAFAADLPNADEALALGHDDVTWPAAEPARTREATVATSGAPEGGEARPSDGSRIAAVHSGTQH